MPLSNNQYSAPTWRNGQGPAIDATELQAMSNTIAENQVKNTSQDSSISALQTAVNILQTGSAKIAFGYTAPVSGGASNPNTIILPFVIKAIWFYGNSTWDIAAPVNPYDQSTHQNGLVVNFDKLTTSYAQGAGPWQEGKYSTVYGKKSADGKTYSWYYTSGGSFPPYWIAFG